MRFQDSQSRTRLSRGGKFSHGFCKTAAFSFLVTLTTTIPALAGDLLVENAWVAPNDTVGSDVGLYMTVKNNGNEADALVRAACPVANFAEKRAVDVGEGGLANRAISNIPIAAHGALTMTSKTFHVGLLQTRDKLMAGDSFICNVTFRQAGPIEVKVTVSPAAP